MADKYGNMVSCTQTINGYYGSGVIPTGLGFPLNNQCSDFGIGWGLPNSVEGGKKPLSSMSPSIVLDPNGDPFLVLGTPGGTRIFPTVMQCIFGAIDYNLTVLEMVNQPRFWYSNGGTLQYEDRIAPAEIAKLEAMGYKTQSFGSGWSRTPGTVNAIMYGGEIVEIGTDKEIFYEPKHPYTMGLINCISNPEDDSKEDLKPIPGSPPDLLDPPKGCPFVERCEKAMRVCKDFPPEVTTFSKTHQCACWLTDERAKNNE